VTRPHATSATLLVVVVMVVMVVVVNADVMMVVMAHPNPHAMMMMMVVMMAELHRDLGRLHVARFRIAPCIVGFKRRRCVRHRV
jgi:hypothetical protein